MSHTPSQVLNRIHKVLDELTICIKENKPPTLTSRSSSATTNSSPPRQSSSSSSSHFPIKSFTNISQCRNLTSIILVLSFVQKLLLSNRTTTNREVYYFFITYFRSQRECDAAISDCCNLLSTERISLGLTASPKGWFCGNIRIITNKQTNNVLDGTTLSSINGLPITREWIHHAAFIDHNHEETNCSSGSSAGSSSESQENRFQIHPEANFEIQSSAVAIIVIEKEGVYHRLSEDKFYNRIPTILITGKGFPDLATRAMVYCLWRTLNLPVYGLADCNPYGIGVLQTYFRGGRGNGIHNRDLYSVPLQWIGLRPSQLEAGRTGKGIQFKLPKEVYQKLTVMDLRKLKGLEEQVEKGNNEFMGVGEVRAMEVKLMKENGWKVELECLHWLGMGFMSDWLEDVMLANLRYREGSDHVEGDVDVDGTEEKLTVVYATTEGRHDFEDECPHDENDHLHTYDPRIAC